MKIIDDNKNYVEALERYAKYNQLPKDADDYTLVNVSLIANLGDKRTERKGILEANKIIRKGEKVALYSFENPQHLYSEHNSLHKEFMKAMSQQSTLFLQLPEMYKEFRAELAEPKYHNLAMDLVSTFSIGKNVAGSLLHSVYRVGIPETVRLANKELGLEGMDEEVIEQLETLRQQGQIIKYDKIIPGLFVDVEGTLLDSENKLNESVIEKMITYKGPVVMWTGGDLKKIHSVVSPLFSDFCKEKNSRLYTRTTVISKHNFRGNQVESVIDDLSQENFVKEYNIHAQNYEQVK